MSTTTLKTGWCHSCDKAVTVVETATDGGLICPLCRGEFVEEIASPSPSPQHQQPDDPFLRNIFELFNAVSARQQQGQRQRPQPTFIRVNIGSGSGSGSGSGGFPGFPFPFFGFPFGRGGAAGAAAAGGRTFAMPTPIFNLFGLDGQDLGEMEFQQLLNHLFATSQAHGTPPAAKSAIEALRRGPVTGEMVKASDACTVCQEPFAVGEEVTFLPCRHAFHNDCIAPWLRLHSSCPTCRAELPTDDPEYESRRRSQQHRR